MRFDRDIFFGTVRGTLFGGSIGDQRTVDGLNLKLDYFETLPDETDLRWFANALGQWHHETGARMYPVRETFADSDAEARSRLAGAPYAQSDPVTGEAYYGRGDVQLTWSDNYKKESQRHDLDLYRNPDLMLDPAISVIVAYNGMKDGVYRGDNQGRHTFARYFNASANDIFEAREIVNGDKHKQPSWADGKSIGQLCAEYHNKYLGALQASLVTEPPPTEPPLTIEAALKLATDAQLFDELKTRPGVSASVILRREA